MTIDRRHDNGRRWRLANTAWMGATVATLVSWYLSTPAEVSAAMGALIAAGVSYLHELVGVLVTRRRNRNL